MDGWYLGGRELTDGNVGGLEVRCLVRAAARVQLTEKQCLKGFGLEQSAACVCSKTPSVQVTFLNLLICPSGVHSLYDTQHMREISSQRHG